VRIQALAVLATGIVLAGGQARAQAYDPAYPVCMHVVVWGGPYEDCSYFTLAQCTASASGRAAQCDINPFYAGATAPLRRNARPHRRVH